LTPEKRALADIKSYFGFFQLFVSELFEKNYFCGGILEEKK
jgi:hypothetical protein